MADPELLRLARAVLVKNRPESWVSAWDSRGTPPEMLSQSYCGAGTVKIAQNQADDAGVPLSQALGQRTVGQQQNSGTALGTVAGQHYSEAFSTLQSKCPDLVENERWQEAVRDAEIFLEHGGSKSPRSVGPPANCSGYIRSHIDPRPAIGACHGTTAAGLGKAICAAVVKSRSRASGWISFSSKIPTQ